MLYPLLRDALLRGAFQRDAFSRVALGNESDGRGVWDQEFVIWCEFDGDNNLLNHFFKSWHSNWETYIQIVFLTHQSKSDDIKTRHQIKYRECKKFLSRANMTRS